MNLIRCSLGAIGAIALSLAAGLHAQIPYAGGAYVQDFDSLPSSGSFTLSGPGPFALDGAPVNASGLAGWSFAKHAGSGSNATFFVSPGSGTSGGTYSYGATGNTERALGALGSGSVASRNSASGVRMIRRRNLESSFTPASDSGSSARVFTEWDRPPMR